MLKNKKFLILFSLVFAFIWFGSVKVSALTFEYENQEFSLPEPSSDNCARYDELIGDSDIEYCITARPYISDDVLHPNATVQILVKSDNISSYQVYTDNGDDYEWNRNYIHIIPDNNNEINWTWRYSYNESTNSWSNVDYGGKPATSSIIYCTLPVYTDNTFSTIYRNADVQNPITPPGEVAQALEGVEMSKVMTEIVGLIPLVAGLLVLVIAFYKGWRLLCQFLRQA